MIKKSYAGKHAGYEMAFGLKFDDLKSQILSNCCISTVFYKPQNLPTSIKDWEYVKSTQRKWSNA